MDMRKAGFVWSVVEDRLGPTPPCAKKPAPGATLTGAGPHLTGSEALRSAAPRMGAEASRAA